MKNHMPPLPDGPALDPIQFRNACGLFGTGVTVISTRNGEVDHGMTANAFMSISLDPPLIAVSIATTARILKHIQDSGRFAVSILEEGTETTAMHFAGRPDERLEDPLTDFDELPVAKQSCTVFATYVVQQIEAGDHVIFLGRVNRMEADPDKAPLMFHKGKFGELLTDDKKEAGIPLDQLWHDTHW